MFMGSYLGKHIVMYCVLTPTRNSCKLDMMPPQHVLKCKLVSLIAAIETKVQITNMCAHVGFLFQVILKNDSLNHTTIKSFFYLCQKYWRRLVNGKLSDVLQKKGKSTGKLKSSYKIRDFYEPARFSDVWFLLFKTSEGRVVMLRRTLIEAKLFHKTIKVDAKQRNW